MFKWTHILVADPQQEFKIHFWEEIRSAKREGKQITAWSVLFLKMPYLNEYRQLKIWLWISSESVMFSSKVKQITLIPKALLNNYKEGRVL